MTDTYEHKRITVEVRLKNTSQKLIYIDIWNTYEKGSFYCICDHTKVRKIPIADIFDILEDY